MAKAILIDTTSCTGCNTCTYRCIQEYGLHEYGARGIFRRYVLISDAGVYHHVCHHCKDPSCVAACPTGALYKTSEGPVLYDSSKCIGCKSCVLACPFHVPVWDEETKTVVKCTMCAGRIAEGRPPACVEACPTGALLFDDYDKVVAEAQRRAAARKLYIYGLEENGGTSVIVLTKEEPTKVGYLPVPKVPIRLGVPSTVAVGVAAAALALGTLKRLRERAEEVKREEEKEKPGKPQQNELT